MPQDLNYMQPTATDKGGGFRGGPRRWTGNGPRPARHVPWPEIFKHHISVLEGHFKMLDMVRKHTVEGSGNHRQICSMINRTQESLRQTKDVVREFVPPNTRDQVPIGSSSASMYPGYSPADIEYGKAAEEVGQMWTKAKSQGIPVPEKIEVAGLEYEIGQSRGGKRKRISTSQTKSEEETRPNSESALESRTNGDVQCTKNAAKDERNAGGVLNDEGTNQYFVLDPNPTPLNLGESPRDSKKEKKDEKEEKAEKDKMVKKNKKRKAESQEENADGEPEKKKNKKKHKESAGSSQQLQEELAAAATAEPERKKKKKNKDRAPVEDSAQSGVEEQARKEAKEKKDKKRKAEEQASGEEIAEVTAQEPEKKKKKKSKKAKAE